MLKEVVLGDSVEIVGTSAFRNCKALENVTFNDRIEKVERAAFDGCSAIESVCIESDSLKSLDLYAFSGCTSLKDISIKSLQTSIEARAFERCDSLVSLYLDFNTVPSVFSGHKNIENVVLGSRVETLSDRAFANCIALNDIDLLDAKMCGAIKRAQASDVNILFETVGYLAKTEKVVGIINHFASSVIGASWNVRRTYFDAGETAETTIKNLGAYIKYVRLGDMKDGKTVLIGEGDLEVEKLLNALSSLNYEGFICAAWNEEISDAVFALMIS